MCFMRKPKSLFLRNNNDVTEFRNKNFKNAYRQIGKTGISLSCHIYVLCM